MWAGYEVPVKRLVDVAKTARFIEDARTNPYLRAADMSILPPDELVASGFPMEQVRIFGTLSQPTVQLLGGRGRTWVHVYRRSWGIELCLWTPIPEEPASLKWRPEDGWKQLFRIIQRHLLLEEMARRNGGHWLIEDAHGTPDDYAGGEYRAPSTKIRSIARKWRRDS